MVTGLSKLRMRHTTVGNGSMAKRMDTGIVSFGIARMKGNTETVKCMAKEF